MAHSAARTTTSTALDTLLSQSSDVIGPGERQVKCCCAASGCPFVIHNSRTLKALEWDLQQAAQIGQALLARHNTYVAQVEELRQEMDRKIQRLENEKKDLESTNGKTIEDNKYLLGQLEELNNSLSDSDAQVTALNVTLGSTRTELDKLTSLAAQTTLLEAQLSAMETEQASLQRQVNTKDQDTQIAVQRWRAAERTIVTLSEQLDSVEKEHREEQTSHAEVVARLERRNCVQKELNLAVDGSRQHAIRSQNSVISNFVKEILQDNANLQMGILELREMLTGSNEEVELLREQALHSQAQGRIDNELMLKTELLRSRGTEVPFHVHHHYHAAKAEARREKSTSIRRPKKRVLASSGLRTPVSEIRTLRAPQSPQVGAAHASSAAAILSQTSVSVPLHCGSSVCPNEQHWMPVSPSSSYQEQSVFDETVDFSRPTTPASTSIGSPVFPPEHYKRLSDASVRSLTCQALPLPTRSLTSVLHSSERREARFAEDTMFPVLDHATIPEEPEEDIARPPIVGSSAYMPPHNNAMHFLQKKPRLHRASSAESVFSMGTNVPQLRPNPSQLLTKVTKERPSLRPCLASAGPVASPMAAVGMNSKGSSHYDSSNYNRLLLAHKQSDTSTPNPQTAKPISGLGKKLGVWMVGKWGSSPELRNQNSCASPPSKPAQGDSFTSQVEAVRINSALLEEALSGD